MNRTTEEKEEWRRLSFVRHVLFGLLILLGVANFRFAPDEAHAEELRDRAPPAIAAIEIVPCRDVLAAGPSAFIVTNDPLPELLPPEREGPDLAVPAARGHLEAPFVEAQQPAGDSASRRSPVVAFSSRAPPLLS